MEILFGLMLSFDEPHIVFLFLNIAHFSFSLPPPAVHTKIPLVTKD